MRSNARQRALTGLPTTPPQQALAVRTPSTLDVRTARILEQPAPGPSELQIGVHYYGRGRTRRPAPDSLSRTEKAVLYAAGLSGGLTAVWLAQALALAAEQ